MVIVTVASLMNASSPALVRPRNSTRFVFWTKVGGWLVTLGPRGFRHVVLEVSFGAPRIPKDSVTVAKEIERTSSSRFGCL
jgi:hypothetical protein